MAKVKWNDLPALSQHHDFWRTVNSLLNHARALEALYAQPAVFETSDLNQLLSYRAAIRNRTYYPSDLQTLEPPSSLDDVNYRSRDVLDRATAEHVAYQTSWSIWNARPFLDRRLPDLWDVMNSWGSLGPAASGISLRYSRYWLDFDAARDWFVIYNLCREAVNVNGSLRSSKIELSFCLSAAAYSKSKHANIVPFIIIFALDERCRDLSPPPDPSYELSDGLTHDLAHIEDLVPKSALAKDFTPAHPSKSGEITAKKVQKLRKAEYYVTIKREASVVAQSILRHWPDCGPVDFREQWFDKSSCNRRIQEYIQSITRNIRLREHVLQLQSILRHYGSVLIPAVTHTFSPQFSTGPPKAPSYSIRDVFVSRTDVLPPFTDRQPFPCHHLSPVEETEDTPPHARSDSLETLIEEFQSSRQTLLRLYGNELNKSYHRLILDASQSARGPVPSRDLLRIYHDECSSRKDEAYSQISAALSPSQNTERISDIAGLWPRVTPRSILRQLAQDRIRMLPDQWKLVIMRYAITLLQYQQSVRLLELSSRQKYEELFREMQAIRNGVLAESTPDWLLVQVSLLPRWWRST
jgi:hypothetical protein